MCAEKFEVADPPQFNAVSDDWGTLSPLPPVVCHQPLGFVDVESKVVLQRAKLFSPQGYATSFSRATYEALTLSCSPVASYCYGKEV